VLPDDLLGGLRGRRLCWELIGLASFDVRRIPRSRVTDQVSQAVEQLHAGGEAPAARRIFDALRRSVDAARHWQESDESDYDLRDPELAEVLRPVGEAVVVSPSTAWWAGGVDVEDQHYVLLVDEGEFAEMPTLTGAAPALDAWRASVDDDTASMRELRRDPDFYSPDRGWGNVTGTWWSAPIQFPIRSSARAIPGFGPVGSW
jgi:hypothetical protein